MCLQKCFYLRISNYLKSYNNACKLILYCACVVFSNCLFPIFLNIFTKLSEFLCAQDKTNFFTLCHPPNTNGMCHSCECWVLVKLIRRVYHFQVQQKSVSFSRNDTVRLEIVCYTHLYQDNVSDCDILWRRQRNENVTATKTRSHRFTCHNCHKMSQWKETHQKANNASNRNNKQNEKKLRETLIVHWLKKKIQIRKH